MVGILQSIFASSVLKRGKPQHPGEVGCGCGC